MGLAKALLMSGRIWFNTRVLCVEENPELSARLLGCRGRVSWAPFTPVDDRPDKVRLLAANWNEPNHPYHLVEGHEVVALRWPTDPRAHLRIWLPAMLDLMEAARRSRVRCFGLSYSLDGPALGASSGKFLADYLESLEGLPHCIVAGQDLKEAMEARLAVA